MKLLKIFFSLSIFEIIEALFYLEVFICTVSTVTFFPLIFNLWIIPHIEKKVDRSLNYTSVIYKMSPVTFVLIRYLEISCYIAIKHIASILGFNPDKINLGYGFALQGINYDVRQATFFELLMCYLAFISIFQFFTLGTYLWFTSK